MTRFRHRLATAVFAAVYGFFSVFGAAIHLLEGHGTHVGNQVVECAEHGHAHDADSVLHEHGGHQHAHGLSRTADDPLHVSARCCDTFTHDCQICHQLSQARAATLVAGAVLGRPLVLSDSPTICDEVLVTFGLGPQAPRGPPALLA